MSYSTCDTLWDNNLPNFPKCKGNLIFKELSEITDTDYLPSCTESYIKQSQWVSCPSGNYESLTKDQITNQSNLYEFDNPNQSAGFVYQLSENLQNVSGQRFINLINPGTESSSHLAKALANNTDAILFGSGVFTGGIVFGLFFFSLFNTMR